MSTQMMIVCLAVLAVVAFAVHRKRSVKAAGRLGASEFSLEATDKTD